MTCRSCQSIITDNFCAECGAAASMPSKKKAKWPLVSFAALVLIAAIGLAYFFTFHERQGDLDARIMSVFRVDGEEVSLLNAGGARADAREGMRLHARYSVITGRSSFCHIMLDADSIVKIDAISDISIAQLTDRLLRINIHRGQVMVNLQDQIPGHELEAVIGNTVISVRGTLFVAGLYAGGEAIVTVLDGIVYVNNVPLFAGYTMRVYDGLEMIYEISPFDFSMADEFLISAVTDNHDRLLAAGFLDGMDFDEAAMAVVYVEDDEPDEYELVVDGVYVDEEPFEEVQPITVGEIIRFGDYDWRVLDVQGNQALLLTEYVLFDHWYHHTFEEVTWETSDIRRYLNNEFFNRFSPQDRARIAQTYVINSNNPWDWSDWGWHVSTPGGRNTWDRVFLLSIDEVQRSFGDSGLVARGATMGANARAANEPAWPEWSIYGWGIMDQFSEARIARDLQGTASRWWLRSPGFAPIIAADVFHDGRLDMAGYNVFREGGIGGGVRPALWLYLDNAAATEIPQDIVQYIAISPELRAAASAFYDVLTDYVSTHGISVGWGTFGVMGAFLADLDDSGIPALIVQFLTYDNLWGMHPVNTAVYAFTAGSVSQVFLCEMGTGQTGSPTYSIAITETGINFLSQWSAGHGAWSNILFMLDSGRLNQVVSLGGFEWFEEESEFYVNDFRVSEETYLQTREQLNIVEEIRLNELAEPPDVVIALLRGMME